MMCGVLLHRAVIVINLAYTSFLYRFLRWRRPALIFLDRVVTFQTGRFRPEERARDGLSLTLLVTLLEKLIPVQQVLGLPEFVLGVGVS